MAKIFISYRWSDSLDMTHRIRESLSEHFGQDNTFIDDVQITPGLDLRKVVKSELAKCEVLLAVIGTKWVEAQFEDGPKKGQRRLDDPTDLVRIEIQTALDRDIPLIPVLVGGARMPGESQLPEVLRDLAFRSAQQISSSTRDFRHHVMQLIDDIEKSILAKADDAAVMIARSDNLPSTPADISHSGSKNHLHTGEGLAKHLKENLPHLSFTDLELMKIAAANPNGINASVIRIPKPGVSGGPKHLEMKAKALAKQADQINLVKQLAPHAVIEALRFVPAKKLGIEQKNVGTRAE